MDFLKEVELSVILDSIKSGRDTDAAFRELVVRYEPMMRSRVASIIKDSCNEAEAMQEAHISLHSAALTYDAEKCEGVTFGLYARICIYRRLCDTVARFQRNEKAVRIEEVDVDRLSDGTNIESRIVGRERMQEYLSRVRSILSDYEYQVFLLYIEGESTASIAKKMGKTSKSVDNAKARMLKHLRRESALFSDV